MQIKNKTPLISVVMLNYNGLKYLKRTIPPILKLDYPNYEFVIVDNGSTDGSIEFIKKFKKICLIKSPRLREKNFACNYAIDRAIGEYIFLIDNDLLIKNKDIIKKLLERYTGIVGEIGVSFYDQNSRKTRGYGSFLGYYFTKLNKNIELKYTKKYDNSKISYADGIGIFIKKSLWKKVGGYDDHLTFGGDDSDLGIKLWMRGYVNILYSEKNQIHLGKFERNNNSKFYYKYKQIVYSNLYTIVKNYSFFNMILSIFLFSIFAFLKSIKQSLFRLHPSTFFAFFQGYYLFLKNLPIALKKRKEIQSKRVIKEDIFLNIKPYKLK